jgi:hypothetical protein
MEAAMSAVAAARRWAGVLGALASLVLARSASAAPPTVACFAFTNDQASSTPAPFQQVVTWNPSTYAMVESADLGNVRFCLDASCAVRLHAWLEACAPSCSPAATSARAWVNLPSGIASDGGTQLIYQVFEQIAVAFDGNFWGEAPDLSPSYGQFDNGASVFTFYDAFAGGALSNKWTPTIGSASSIQVNNGATFTNTGNNSFALLVTATTLPQPAVGEAFIISESSYWPKLGLATSVAGDGMGHFFPGYYVTWELASPSIGHVRVTTAGVVAGTDVAVVGTGFNPGIWQVAWAGQGAESGSIAGAPWSSMDATAPIGNVALYLGQACCIPASVQVRWARLRASPPGGVMPLDSACPADAGSGDAGVGDAGTPDSGASDGGIGSPDAGLLDGGPQGDGGGPQGSLRRFTVGCDCSEGSAWPLALLAVMTLGRRLSAARRSRAERPAGGGPRRPGGR